MKQYEWLLQKRPEDTLVLNNLAFAYQQMKDPRALSIAERAYKLQPDSPDVADTYGWLLIEQGNVARGVEVLQKAVSAAPKAPAFRYHLAQGWLKAGDRNKARTELETLLATGAKSPEAEQARKLLGQLSD